MPSWESSEFYYSDPQAVIVDYEPTIGAWPW